MKFHSKYLANVYAEAVRRNEGEQEFLQAVGEVLQSLGPVVEKRPDIVRAGVIDRIVEPERMISFRVSWVDDNGGCRSTAVSVCSSIPLSDRTRAAFASTRR